MSFGNVKLIPCPDTLHALPWVTQEKFRVGEILCETFWTSDNPQEMCPRYVARKQLERMRNHGYTLTSGWEFEFMLMEGEDKEPLFKGHYPIINFKLAAYEPFLYELDSFLVGSGVDVESCMTEFGLSQFELATNVAEGIRAGDMAFNVKEAVKEICAQNNQTATFRSKPLPNENGNGLHFNHSVFNLAGHNAFYNPKADDNLSDVARYWMAGLITHAGALTAICSPTVNCYRRLHQPWAPDCSD